MQKIHIALMFVAVLLCYTVQAQNKKLQNPFLDHDFPDPTVIKAADGKYYAYATQTRNAEHKWVDIQVAVSPDGFSWSIIGDALPVKPAWASHTQDFWAPHVLYDSISRQYIMFYSAESDDTATGKCLGIAVSNSPAGPFTDEGSPLLAGPGFVNIDPMAFIDPVTHKNLLYWGSGFKPVRVQEMSDDWKSFKPGSVAKDVVFPKKDSLYSILVEGAWVDFNAGKYYLYYSGDNCCGARANYAVMVARADNAMGPFTRLSEAKGGSNSAILEQDSTWLAPGHNSLFRDVHGDLYIAYHAVWKDKTKAGKEFKRVMCINKVVYKNGWPVIVKIF